MSRDARRASLLTFLESIVRPDRDPGDLAGEDSLVESGLIDSLALLEIVTHLEDEYAFDFRERGVDPEELRNVESILDLIDSAVGAV